MKTIGLLGGMSWQSTQTYYQLLNEHVSQRLGGHNSARIVLNSINFAPVEALQHQGDWQGTAKLLVPAAKQVEAAGADFLLICTNTMHKVYDDISAELNIPVLHIADTTAHHIRQRGVSKVGLLGTRFTMEDHFYKGRLTADHGLEVVVPDTMARETVHQVIYRELCHGTVSHTSKTAFLDIIKSLRSEGAEAVILGCTEIGLLVNQSDTPMELVDTVQVHAAQAVALALHSD